MTAKPASAGQVPSICGIPIKHVALMLLVVQNSGLILLMRCSRLTSGPRYLTSTAVILSEAIKAVVCTGLYLRQQDSKQDGWHLPEYADTGRALKRSRLPRMRADIFGPKSGFLKMMVPAVLYTLQNNLQFVAASNLDAATFQVSYQGKILTTAFFAVVILRQSLAPRKWLALLILTAGVALVQVPSSTASAVVQGNWTVGMTAVMIACILSGLAGVYFEKILKGESTTSIWVRNIQLSSTSILIAAFGAWVWDGRAIRQIGFFQGYNALTVATILVQALGGLLVAVVVKFADNILKGFATSISIVLSVIASVFLFDFVITVKFLVGATLVLFATYLYSLADAPQQRSDSVFEEREAKPLIADQSAISKKTKVSHYSDK